MSISGAWLPTPTTTATALTSAFVLRRGLFYLPICYTLPVFELITRMTLSPDVAIHFDPVTDTVIEFVRYGLRLACIAGLLLVCFHTSLFCSVSVLPLPSSRSAPKLRIAANSIAYLVSDIAICRS